MTSDLVATCDAIANDLIGNVTGLGPDDCPNVHLYNPAAPEELIPDGQRHLAVWPVGEGEGNAEQGGDMFSDSVTFDQLFAVVVWQDSGTEATRLVSDEDGARAFLELYNSVRTRLMQKGQSYAGAWLTRVQQTRFPEKASLGRWFRLIVLSRRQIPFT